VGLVGSSHQHVNDVLDACDRLIAARPEVEVLSSRRRVLDDEDLD